MWWEPITQYDREVSDWILGLGIDQFLSVRERGTVFGVGSYIANEKTRPLILLNSDELEISFSIPQLLPLQLLPLELQEQFKNWEVLNNTLFLIITEPEPLSNTAITLTTGNVIRCSTSRKFGTTGPEVEFINEDQTNLSNGILTAGHVTPKGVGSNIQKVEHRRLLSPRYEKIGSVVFHNDPKNQNIPGYDISVIQLDKNVHFNGFWPSGIASARNLTPLNQPKLCHFYGGVSGTVKNVGIVGALNCFGNKKRLWKNSWLMLPSSIAAKGDSGSLVSLHHTGEAVGLLVGGSKPTNAPWYFCWYAQDISSIQTDYLTPQNVRIIN